jgi:hypothetical protein
VGKTKVFLTLPLADYFYFFDFYYFCVGGRGSTSASSLCGNPCWEAALMACEGFKHDEFVLRLDVTDDFCAINVRSEYCRDLYQPGSWTCERLQVTGQDATCRPIVSLASADGDAVLFLSLGLMSDAGCGEWLAV